MRITLTGATGLLGRYLIGVLAKRGHALSLLARKQVTGLPADVKTFLWDPPRVDAPAAPLQDADAVIHLAGAPVNQRWTAESKALIRSSRVGSTRALVQSLSTLSARPSVLLSASAIGFYGERGDEVLTEESAAGTGFLADLSVEWEHEANLARGLGLRVNCLRTGVVLSEEGGALASMLPPFRFGVGGKLGGGEQWLSWIHIADYAGIVLSLLETKLESGPVNLTAPNPVRNSGFTLALGRVLRRPALFTVPAFALKLVLGEMSTIALASQRVLPKQAQSAGYPFRFPDLENGLRDLLQ